MIENHIFFQSEISHEEIENTLQKNISNLDSGTTISHTNDIADESKNSESSCIQELVSQNYELKNLILRVSYF